MDLIVFAAICIGIGLGVIAAMACAGFLILMWQCRVADLHDAAIIGDGSLLHHPDAPRPQEKREREAEPMGA